jgi:hypothetical protein
MRIKALVIGLLVFLAAAPGAQASKALARVHISAEATDAVTAQKKALQQGEAEAFYDVIKQRDAKRAEIIISKVSPEQRALLVKSVSIENEQMRAGRYEADITYVFEESKIQALVEEQQGLVTDIQGNGLMVLPLYVDGKSFFLWEPENYWRSVMARQILEAGKGELVVPFGDPKDAMILPAAKLLGGATEPIMELARRYGTVHAAIVSARLIEQNGRRAAEIRLSRPGNKSQEEIMRVYPAERDNEPGEAILQRAAKATVALLHDTSKEFSLFAKPEAQKLKGRVVRAEFSHARRWTQIRQQMEGLPGVEFIEIGAVAPSYAQVTLYYRGEESLIANALQQRGLTPQPTGDYWTISLP